MRFKESHILQITVDLHLCVFAATDHQDKSPQDTRAQREKQKKLKDIKTSFLFFLSLSLFCLAWPILHRVSHNRRV